MRREIHATPFRQYVREVQYDDRNEIIAVTWHRLHPPSQPRASRRALGVRAMLLVIAVAIATAVATLACAALAAGHHVL
ncbi:hypothetical protein RAS2_05950 [Phycisphaerae bacterium RAS2]|nr:hypothetical protein RAS2_05950 [Phycisphaerae bacterium RAS2]